jgi:N-acyl-L-homoserine lactone synthetase
VTEKFYLHAQYSTRAGRNTIIEVTRNDRKVLGESGLGLIREIQQKAIGKTTVHVAKLDCASENRQRVAHPKVKGQQITKAAAMLETQLSEFGRT